MSSCSPPSLPPLPSLPCRIVVGLILSAEVLELLIVHSKMGQHLRIGTWNSRCNLCRILNGMLANDSMSPSCMIWLLSSFDACQNVLTLTLNCLEIEWADKFVNAIDPPLLFAQHQANSKIRFSAQPQGRSKQIKNYSKKISFGVGLDAMERSTQD